MGLLLVVQAEPSVRDRWEPCDVASLARMLYRFAGAVRRAAREETFVAVVGAAVALVLTGTVVYTLGEGWRLVHGFLLRSLHADHVEHR